jgi:hypothetical protein
MAKLPGAIAGARIGGEHADVWSAYATTSSLPGAFAPMTGQLDRICANAGRDPRSIGRSVGVFVEPDSSGMAERLGLGLPITGSVGQIIDTIGGFADVGVTRVEIHPLPHTMDALEKLAPVYEALTLWAWGPGLAAPPGRAAQVPAPRRV